MIGEIVPPGDRREERVDELGLLQEAVRLLAGPDDTNQKDKTNTGEDRKGDKKALKKG